MPIKPLSYPAIFGTFAVTVVISVLVQMGSRPLGIFPVAVCLELASVYPVSREFVRLKAATGSVPARLRLINIPAAIGFGLFMLVGLKGAIGLAGVLAGCLGAMLTMTTKLLLSSKISSSDYIA